ncbi:radical SAM protein [Chloroflexota bacterium]
MSFDKTRKGRKAKTSPKERLSREEGTIIKDWGGRLPVALIYPNSYYLGMSNLGIHVIYRLLNSYDKVVGERVFWEIENRDEKLAALSLESHRPLPDFAVLAFSISYELDYFNVLSILKASGIPLHAADRDERHPVIIAGGPCISANPIPLSPFFDCLCIGEAEPIVSTILPALSEGIGGKRDELLKALASLPGVYVPLYPRSKVVRQWARNLDDFPATSTILTPDTELGDLYLIEVERGCHWGCRFCLVNITFSPMRFRSIDKLMEQAEQGLGYRKRLGLVGPAVSDHPQFEELLGRLHQMGAKFSISSLRINRLTSKALTEIVRGGAQTIVLAPEAGSQRLRQVIKKDICEDDILAATDKLAGQRLKQIKLYFMLGLPSETDEDIEAIIKLALECKNRLDKQQSGTRLTLNIAPFVPKAGTPFQWSGMVPLQILNQRLSRLKNKLSPKGIKIKSESPAWSQIQGVMARGDTQIAEALENIEEVSLAGWRRVVEKCHLDIDFYACQSWDFNQELPWAVIDSGIKPEHLESELKKALL